MSLLMLLFLFLGANTMLFSQSRTITGVVVDSKNESLSGAYIIVKGTKQGTSTDENGHFSLPITSQNVTLEVSFIGYKTLTIEINTAEKQEYILILEEDATWIEGVVITGAFTRKANSYTGAVSVVRGEELKAVGNANILASLKVIDPSFMIVDNLSAGSDPNAMVNIQMRGQTGFSDITSSQSNPNQPLFILNGFETTLTTILDLDMNLINSVTLLKDATAKAIYGSKAGNGVVVIETKQPEEGKIRITYNGSIDVEAPDLSSYNLCDIHQKLQAELNAGYYSVGEGGSVVTQLALNNIYTGLLQKVEAGVNTDWLVQPLRIGVGQKHSLYLEGGDKSMLYGVNLSHNNVSGAMQGSDRNTFDGSISLTYRTKSLQFRNLLSISNNTANNSPYGSFSNFALLNPYDALYDEDGNMIRQYTNGTVVQYNHLLNGTINTIDQSKYTNITENFYAEWRLIDNLKLTGRVGIIKNISSNDLFKPSGHTDFYNYAGADLYKAGSYIKTNGLMNQWLADLGVDYSISTGKHLFFTNLMTSWNESKYDNTSMMAQGFASDNMRHIAFAIEYAGTKPYGSEGISRTFGALGSLNYSYDNRYLLDANYRLSGSSEFGANKRWGSFWSVGIGWNIHNEAFMKDASWVNNLKLRASTGFTGTQGFSTYEAVPTLNYYTSQQYGGAIGSYIVGLANPDLQWQKKLDNNLGIDFSLFKGLLNARFDLYKATTKGLITSVTTPQSIGFSSYTANLGESENIGYEAYLSLRLLQSKEKRNYLNVFGALSHNKNTLKKVANSLKAMNDKTDGAMNEDASKTSVAVRYEEGASMNAIWAVRSMGIDPETGKEVYIKKDGTLSYKWNAADQVVCGDALPSLSGNFGLNGEVNGLGMNFVFTWQYGGQIYNTTLVQKVENANARYNVDERVLYDRWSEPGQLSRFKAIADNSYTQPTQRFVEDNNTLNMASISLYYDFRDTKVVKNTFLERCKLTFYMNDLFTLSSVKIERGTSYPYSRKFAFSLQVTL